MAIKNINSPSTLGGFDVLSNALTGGGDSGDNDFPYKDPDDIDLGDVDDKNIQTDDDSKDTDVDINKDDDIDDSDSSTNKDVDKDDDKGDKSIQDEFDPEVEKEVSSFVMDRLSDELGFDIDKDAGIDSVKDIVDYLKDVVDEASTPEYASDEVKQLDEFVKSGGKLEDFVNSKAAVLDLDKMDISSEGNQKRVLEEHLKSLGYNDDRIKKAVDRYEDAGVLEEEAQDALELLKEHRTKQQDQLLEQQKKYAQHVEKQQQEFVSNVQDNIENLKDIKGVPVSNKEKKELLDYIFKTDSDGQTQFQKEFDTQALIEAAYFRKMGKNLVLKAKQQGSSDAYKNFHQKLKSSKKRQKSAQVPGEKQYDAMKNLGSLLVG